MLKGLTIPQANSYLLSVGMELGGWNQIAAKEGEMSWLSYPAPESAKELLCFSRHVAGWVPSGDWKLIQFDNSAMFDPTEAASISRLTSGANGHVDLSSSRAFLIEYGDDPLANANNNLVLADLIFMLLLFESHAYVTSSGSGFGQVLGVQDGTVHFGARNVEESGAELLLRRFEREPLSPPKWITEIIAMNQT